MPANLPPDYYAAERRYREARDISEKIDILRQMMALMPKHKGTEHLQGDLKRKIAKLQNQSQKKQIKSKHAGLDHIPTEGAGQVVLVGLPNSGKSSILSVLTHAKPEIADFPFSTFRPLQGMMSYDDIQIQLVDLPPLSEDYTEHWVFNIIRLADIVLLTIDLSKPDPVCDMDKLRMMLENHKIILKKKGEGKPCGTFAEKTTLVVGSKSDMDETSKKMDMLQKQYRTILPVIPVSILDNATLDALGQQLFQLLDIIRVYTKMPGKKSDYEKPYILPQGTTVFEAARSIHKDFADQMTFARIWGTDTYDGQRVEKDHVLMDKGIIEIHTR